MSTGSLQCPRCGGPKKPSFTHCWRCHTDDMLQSEYERGYHEGLRAGDKGIGLDARRLRQLIQLCHPDRHAGSIVANDATTWLLEQCQRVGQAH